VAHGCCAEANAHRRAVIAIDFVPRDRSGRLFSGAADQLAGYAYFGLPVYSVADGTVIATHDGEPEEVPGKLLSGKTLAALGGNFVSVDIG
jgi:hypothetical protein